MKEAIILCGGEGKRLRSITNNKIPKSLVQIQGKSILERQITWLLKFGLEKIVLAVGHRQQEIDSAFSDFPDAEIVISNESGSALDPGEEPGGLGTGGSLKLALEKINSDTAILLYGDILTDFDLSKLIEIHQKEFNLVTMFLTPLRTNFGVVRKFNHKIVGFEEKPLLPYWINGGIFAVDTLMKYALPLRGSLEKELLPKLARMQLISHYIQEKTYRWISIETEKDYDEANNLYAPDT